MALEIERKFIMDKFPEHLPMLCKVDIWQGYISVDPEVRIHKAKDLATGIENYRLTLKGDGTLTRTEIKTDISKEFYEESLSLMAGEVVYKDYRSYDLEGYVLEVCHVDPGKPSEFFYGEIEFPTEEDASEFVKPKFLGEEVTDSDYYKMKQYWKRSRLK